MSLKQQAHPMVALELPGNDRETNVSHQRIYLRLDMTSLEVLLLTLQVITRARQVPAPERWGKVEEAAGCCSGICFKQSVCVVVMQR